MGAAEVERAAAWIAAARDEDRDALTAWLLADGDALAADFAALIARGLYDHLIALLRRDRPGETDVLRALGAARPTYGADELNADALDLMQSGGPGRAEYDLLIVPGYTPLGATGPTPLDECAPAVQRLELAIGDLDKFVAPFVLVTGGAVHPPGTSCVEALMMRDRLIARGVPPARIVVDPFARHSTTNLRNAARVMLQTGLKRALIITGFDNEMFDQAFYFANPILSTYQQRCRAELGYLVGELSSVDDHRVAFTPAPDCAKLDYRDPFDY